MQKQAIKKNKKKKVNHSLSRKSFQEPMSSHAAMSEGKIWHLQDCLEISKEICPDELNKQFICKTFCRTHVENSSTVKMNPLAKLFIYKTKKEQEGQITKHLGLRT